MVGLDEAEGLLFTNAESMEHIGEGLLAPLILKESDRAPAL